MSYDKPEMTHRLEVTLFIAKHEDLLRSYMARDSTTRMSELISIKKAMFGDKAHNDYAGLIHDCILELNRRDRACTD